MKKAVLFTVALLNLLPVLTADAQTSALVAGWDFNDLGSSPGGLQSVAANYGDDYTTHAPIDGVNSAVRGTFLANGTGGSELLPLTATTGVSISNTPDLVDREILTRGPSTPTATRNLGYIPGAENALQVAQRNTLNAQTFSFKIDGTGVKDLNLSLWLAKSAASNLTIEWSYQIGSGAVQSLGVTTDLSSLGANTYTNVIVDFRDVSALDNQSEIYLIAAANTTATTAFGLRLDNTGIYGSLNSVVSTALNIWKGGDGVWTAATTSTNWQNADGTTSAAWTPDVATFRGTPGTVTVDTAGGPVVFTGAKFEVTGYTVAGGTLTTETAGTAVQVGNGTSAGSAMSATISAPIGGTGGISKTDLGTLTLSGANTYTGTTTVSAGTLRINGSQSGAVNVASGARLGGTGTAGGITVQNGGSLVGQAGSLLTMSSLVLNPTSILSVTLGAPSTAELFKVNGALTLDGTLNVTGSTGFGAGVYRLFNYTGTLTDNTLVAGTMPSGFTASEIQTSVANQVNVVFTAGSTAGGLAFWAGGPGTWSAGSSTRWKDASGTQQSAWGSGMAIFQGTAGTGAVAVDTAGGAVVFTGLQFASTGYTVTGGALTTNTPVTALRVGDGTSAGANMTGTISSAIVGTGGIDKTDLGKLILSGANTYAGGTTVSAGVLEVADNGNLGASTGNLTLNGGTLRTSGGFTTSRNLSMGVTGGTIDTGSNNLVLQGAIGGSGALTKTGSGILTLSSNNTFTGATMLSQGAIVLNGGSLGGTSIGTGGRLSGIGTIIGNLTNSGALSPGSSAGTITVNGNFTQDATGTLAIELASLTSFDSLIATGTAKLAGTLSVTFLNGFVPQGGQVFKIIEAAGGITGTFSTLLSPLASVSPMIHFEALYGAKDVRLSLTQLPFGEISGATASQIALGKGLDGAIALGTIPNLQKSLNALPTVDKVKQALNELSPQRYDRWFDQAVYSADATLRTIESRMEQVMREPRGSLWSEVVRRESRFDATMEKTKATGSANGILVGGDARVLPDFQLGVVFGYTSENLELDENGSTTDVKRFTGSMYGRYDLSPVFVEAVVGASHASLDSRRTVAVPGNVGVAASSNNSSEAYGSLRVGYTFLTRQTKITPYAAANYVSWSADAVNETGANEANLKVQAQSRSSLASRAGFTMAFPFISEDVSFIPKLDISWRHEFRDAQRTLAAEIGGSPFMLEGSGAQSGGLSGNLGLNQSVEETKRNGMIAGLGMDVTFGSRLTAYLRLSSEWSTAANRAFEARAGTEFRF